MDFPIRHCCCSFLQRSGLPLFQPTVRYQLAISETPAPETAAANRAACVIMKLVWEPPNECPTIPTRAGSIPAAARAAFVAAIVQSAEETAGLPISNAMSGYSTK